jgi:hypothetical protein
MKAKHAKTDDNDPPIRAGMQVTYEEKKLTAMKILHFLEGRMMRD